MNDVTTDIAPRSERAALRTELIETIKLAAPLALTQLGQVAMMTTDLALIGRLGDEAVAGAALGHAVLFSAFMFGLGVMAAVAPLAAQAVGAREPRLVRRTVRVGLWAAVLGGVPLTLLQLRAGPLLTAFGQAPEITALTEQYLSGLAWSLVPSWLFTALRSFMSAVNRPRPVLWITLAAIPTNAVLAYALIYGAFGMPKLDLLGAGLATTIVNIGMFAAAVWVCYARRPFRKYHVLGNFWHADWPLFGRLCLVGLPISAAFLLEHGLFAGAALMMGVIGTTALTAHQVALQVTAIVFMVPLGIGIAAMVRVGHAVGRRDVDGVRRAGFAAILLGVAVQATMAVCVALTRDYVPVLFLGMNSDPQTVALAATLLLFGASFFIADGVQTIAAGALRGLSDVRVPFLFAAISFWLVGFASGFALAFPAGLGAVGIWAGLVLGLGVYAILLVWRFRILARRGYLPEVSGMGGLLAAIS